MACAKGSKLMRSARSVGASDKVENPWGDDPAEHRAYGAAMIAPTATQTQIGSAHCPTAIAGGRRG